MSATTALNRSGARLRTAPHSQASSAAADEGNTIRISRSSCDKGVQARQHVGEGEWFSQAGRHRVPPGAELTSTAYMDNREDHACVEQLEKQRIVVGALIHPVCTIDTEQAGSGTGAISPTDKSNGDPNAISSLAEKFLRLVDILVERSQLDPRLGFVQVDPATQGPVHIGADAHSENRTIPVGQGRDAQFRTSGATHRTDARQRNCRLGDDDLLVPLPAAPDDEIATSHQHRSQHGTLVMLDETPPVPLCAAEAVDEADQQTAIRLIIRGDCGEQGRTPVQLSALRHRGSTVPRMAGPQPVEVEDRQRPGGR